MTGPRVGLPSLGGEMTKLRVGLLFGGRSGEHEVSLRMAANLLAVERVAAADQQRGVYA